ncbi:MAG: RNA polymerase sigma factor [Terriglobia bacterium]|jgi:RNA polymerase sigma-70 factor (ECF subfamily)
MTIRDEGAAGERVPVIGPAIRPQLRAVTDEAKAQARRRSVLSTDFDAIYKQYRRRVFLWCLRIARNAEDAEDLTQDAFLTLCRKINTYRGESAFSTWLYRLTTNIALMRLRRKTLPQTSLDEILEAHEGAINPRQEIKSFDRTLAASVARVDLERMVDQMPGGFRKAFFLHDSEDYSHPEIAELTGWSIGTSKSQLHRARRRLRKLLECEPGKASRTSMSRGVRPDKKAGWVGQSNPAIEGGQKTHPGSGGNRFAGRAGSIVSPK